MLQLSSWIVATLLGLAPAQAEPGWLDRVPASADIAVRTKGLESTRLELVAMVKAMSSTFGDQVGPALEQPLAQFKAMYGGRAATEPFVILIRAVPPEDPAKPPFAVIIKSEAYENVLKEIAGGVELKLTKEAEGLDSFPVASGQTWYAAKSSGYIAFGPDKPLVTDFAKLDGKSLGKGISAAQRKRFESGDICLYVNLKALAERYQTQIADAKKSFLGLLDQAGAQAGNAGMMDMVKKMYGGMFDTAKDADALLLSFDFDASGLNLDGELTVKEGTEASKVIASSRQDDAADLAKLPDGSAYYVYLDLDPNTYQALQSLGLSMMSASGKPSAELEALLEKMQKVGRVETFGSTTMNKGIRAFNVVNVSDPKTLLQLSEKTFQAMKGLDGPLNFFKDVIITPKAEEYAGYTFTKVEVKLDLDKLGKLQGNNPAALTGIKNMYGGDSLVTWCGINDKQMIQIARPTFDKVKEDLDRYLKGGSPVGSSKGYEAVRSKLPKSVSMLSMISAQGILEQFAGQFGIALPADLPKEVTFVGASLTMTAPAAFEFHLVVPSAVGPVFEKGVPALVQGIQAGAKP